MKQVCGRNERLDLCGLEVIEEGILHGDFDYWSFVVPLLCLILGDTCL